MKSDLNKLKEKYQHDLLDEAGMAELEKAIENGEIDLNELASHKSIEQELQAIDTPPVPYLLDRQIEQMINAELAQNRTEDKINRQVNKYRYLLTAAALLAGIIIGFVIPTYITPSFYNGKDNVSDLKSQMNNLQETIMLSLLEKESASERLKAVAYSEDIEIDNNKIISALLNTLNQDNNINVRLAAVEALQKFGKNNWVREELVRSINHQDSPLVQVALAELMVTLQEKAAIGELKKLMDQGKTPVDIKKKIQNCIQSIS